MVDQDTEQESPRERVRRLNAEIQALRQAGDPAGAVTLAREVCDVIRAAGGERSLMFAQALGSLGELCRQAGAYQEAEQALVDGLALQQRLTDDSDPSVAPFLRLLSTLRKETGDRDAARKATEAMVAIQRRSEPHDPALVASLNNLGGLAESMGDYAAAAQAFREARDVARADLGEDHPHYALSINNLAGLYDAMGDYVAAAELFTEALDRWREHLDPTDPHIAAVLDNLAALRYRQGRYEEAEDLCSQARAIWRKSSDPARRPEVATNLNNLASIYQDTGRARGALDLREEAVELCRSAMSEQHPLFATALDNLGVLYLESGRLAEAEQALNRAHQLRVALLGVHPDVAVSLRNLARLDLASHRPEDALQKLEKSSVIADRTLSQAFSVSSDRQRLAYLATLRLTLDVHLSVVMRCFATSAPVVLDAVDHVLRRKGLAAEALAAQRDAILGGRHPELADDIRQLTDLRRSCAQAMLSVPPPGLVEDHQARLAEDDAARERLETQLAEKIPELRLERTLATADARAVGHALPRDSALVEYVRFREFDVESTASHTDDGWRDARYAAFVVRAGDPEHPHLVDLGDAATLDGLVARFRESVTGHAEQSPGDDPAADPPPDGPGIEATVRAAMLRATRDMKGPAAELGGFDPAAGVALRRAVFDPLVRCLGKTARLVLAPDGDLTRVPFEALPTDDGGFLLDGYRISYVSVGRDVLRVADPARSLATATAPIVIADPDFDLGSAEHAGTAQQRFRRLDGTRAEGLRVAGLLEVDGLMGAEAISAMVEAARSPRILHLATHGFFVGPVRDETDDRVPFDWTAPNSDRLARLGQLENPLLRSGLALAGANTWLAGEPLPDGAGHGLLTGEDVTALDLVGTALVVLSACDTGLGQVQAGEGVFGMRRAFMLSGAQTLVMSLWRVPDEETRQLMERFYERLLAGHEPADALRGAQDDVRRDHPHARDWAAFVCLGSWVPLTAQP